MGWTETHKNKGETMTEFFVNSGVLSWKGNTTAQYKVLNSAFVKLSTFYAAVERIDNESGNRDVFAVIILVKMFNNKPNRSGIYRGMGGGPDYNICYKDMDETVGPCECECPERILKLLTPTDIAAGLCTCRLPTEEEVEAAR